MIDNRFHIELGGVKYRLHELENGGHYQRSVEPLRPPNSVVEQGGDQASPRFQMRPDVLLWTITDWSGGEGQIKLDPQSTSRHWRLSNVDPFTEPGKLMPGPYTEECYDSTGAAILEKSLTLVVGAAKLWGLDQNADSLYEWDAVNGKWKAVVATLTGPTGGASSIACGDATNIYYKEKATDSIWRYPCAASTCTEFNNDTSVTGADGFLYTVGDYLYLHQASTGKVWEIDKAGTPVVASTLIDDPSAQKPDNPTANGEAMAAPGDNRLYTAQTWFSGLTTIREIVPTSATGAGYGVEIARLPGFVAESIWFSAGMLYISGYEDVSTRMVRSILYLQPGGEYGTMGRVRQGETIPASVIGGPYAQRMVDHGFVVPIVATGSKLPGLFLLSSISGGMALCSTAAYTGASAWAMNNVLSFDGSYFYSSVAGATVLRSFRTHPTKFAGSAVEAITPWHDFGLVEEKVLQSMRLNCEALPANWTVTLSYAVNGSTSFTSAGAYDTDNGTGTAYSISTSAAVKLFRTLRVKIAMSYDDGVGGIPTTRPKVTGVEVRAAAGSTGVTVWRLLLDCNNEHTEMQGKSRTGATKLANVATAYDADVVNLKDGYRSDMPNVYSTHNVTIDEYTLEVMQPGEGTALVTLREVV